MSKSKQREVRAQSGLGMLEVMMLLGLLAAGVFSAVEMVRQGNRTVKDASIHMDWNDQVSQISAYLSNQETCRYAILHGGPSGGPLRSNGEILDSQGASGWDTQRWLSFQPGPDANSPIIAAVGQTNQAGTTQLGVDGSMFYQITLPFPNGTPTAVTDTNTNMPFLVWSANFTIAGQKSAIGSVNSTGPGALPAATIPFSIVTDTNYTIVSCMANNYVAANMSINQGGGTNNNGGGNGPPNGGGGGGGGGSGGGGGGGGGGGPSGGGGTGPSWKPPKSCVEDPNGCPPHCGNKVKCCGGPYSPGGECI